MIPIAIDVVNGDHSRGRRAGRLGLGIGEGKAVGAIRVQAFGAGAGGGEGATPAACGRDLPMRSIDPGPRLQELRRRSGVDLWLRPYPITISASRPQHALSRWTHVVRRTDTTGVVPDAQPMVKGSLIIDAPQARPVQPTAFGAMIWKTRS